MLFFFNDSFKFFQIAIIHSRVITESDVCNREALVSAKLGEIEVLVFVARLEVFLEVLLLDNPCTAWGFDVEVIVPKLAVGDTVSFSIAKSPVLVTANSKALGSAVSASGVACASSQLVAIVESHSASSSTVGPMARSSATSVLGDIGTAKITVLRKLDFFDRVSAEILVVGARASQQNRRSSGRWRSSERY